MELTVVIPAYNEAGRIGSTIRMISEHLQSKHAHFDILVIDDGSTDETVKVVKGINDPHVSIVSLGGNRGKGFAVWKGLTAAKRFPVLFSDADLSTPIEDIDLLFPHIGTHDIVIGSRNLPDSVITRPQPWLRSHLGKTFPLLVRLLVLPGIKDTQCGFKLFSEKAIKAITPYQRIFDFGFDVEQLFIARAHGLTIKEAGIHWGNADGSKVHPLRDSKRMLADLLIIRWNALRGRYHNPKTI